MEVKDKHNHVAQIEENSKPIIVKRIASVLLDIGLLFLAFFGFYTLILNTGMANNYYHFQNEMMLAIDDSKLESGFGVIEYCEDGKDYSDYAIHTDEFGYKYVVVNVPNPSDEVKRAYQESLNNNEAAKNAQFSMNLHNYLLVLFTGGLPEIIFFLVIPLANKKRATIGMMLFKISLLSTKYEEHAHWYHVLIRFLFILIVESALPYLWLANYTFLIVPVINFIIIILNKQNRTLRDFISRTRYIEEVSYNPIVEDE